MKKRKSKERGKPAKGGGVLRLQGCASWLDIYDALIGSKKKRKKEVKNNVNKINKSIKDSGEAFIQTALL